MLALRQRHIEQVDALRRLVDDRLQRALERFETDNLELAHLRDRIGALGVLDPSLPERGCEVRLDRDVMGLVVHRLVFCPLFRSEGSANPPDRKHLTPRGFFGLSPAQSPPLIMERRLPINLGAADRGRRD